MKSSSVRASKEFIQVFDMVMKHYECTPEEVEQAKEAVRNDYENAEICYLEIAKEIAA